MSTHIPQADPTATPPVDEPMEEGEEGLDGYASSSPPSSEETSTLTWIAWFTSLPGHDYYCEVLEDFIEDDFNLTGLQSQVPFWKEALEMVLDVEPEEDSHTIPDISIIESSAELLYGLVHQRFILTKVGLQQMVEKYEQSNFGACPRVLCHSTPVLPCGRSDSPGLDTVKLFCPNCGDIYGPPSSRYANVDGAFFGTTFAMLFFQTYPEFLSMPFCPPATDPTPGAPSTATTTTGSILPSTPGEESADQPPSGDVSTVVNPNENGGQRYPHAGVYEPRIYGFKVSERARSGPRMTWLRQRPHTADELETVDWRGRFVSGNEAGTEDSGAGPSGRGGGSGSGSGSGKLFDDDEEEKDEESEEEEEDDAKAAQGDGAAAGQGKQRTVASTTTTASTITITTPTSTISPPLPLFNFLAPIPPTSHHFLPTPAPRRRRRNPACSETETESELETPAEDAVDRAVAWHERRKRVVVRRGKDVEPQPKGKNVELFGSLLQTVEDEMMEGVVAV